MPRDRLTRRALVVSTTVVLLAVSTGCLRSSFLRPSAEPIPSHRRRFRQARSCAPSRPPAQVSPARRYRLQLLSLRPRPIPRLSFLRLCRSRHRTRIRAHLPRLSPRHQPSRPYRKPRPRHCRRSRHPRRRSTPLLDAALERVEAINHLEDDSPDSSATLAEPADKNPHSGPKSFIPGGFADHRRIRHRSPSSSRSDTTEKPKSPNPRRRTTRWRLDHWPRSRQVAKKIEAPADRPPPAASPRRHSPPPSGPRRHPPARRVDPVWRIRAAPMP